ncbi:hypothetical protein D7S86_15720 [Pararobbsia silviterrae]|uniref:Uncharacterized protein n=1 Tax=Pararobbsia silviterrae TaxID=1792498 RepID=A0A494XXG0_9BURK|nr:hypothetical protein D7S86_15720 [Pararobbsia silviterrae]
MLDSLWTVFNPLSGIRVNARIHAHDDLAEDVELLKAPPIDVGSDGPVFRYLDWPKSTEQAHPMRGISLGDSSVRILAALAEERAKPAPIGLSRLPPSTECKLVTLSGGFAVLSNRGCVVVDDWHEQRLRDSEIIPVMRRASEWRSQLRAHESNLIAFNAQWKGESDARGTGSALTEAWLKEKSLYQLLGQVALARSTLASQRVKASAAIPDANARLLYQQLKSFWELPEREAYVDQGYQQIEASVKALLEARSARLLRFLGMYGFPAFISSNFSKATAGLINSGLVAHPPTAFGHRLAWTLPPAAYDACMAGGELLTWIGWTLLLAWVVGAFYHRWDPVSTPKAAKGRKARST